jgi:cytochrome c biogenesis protein CcmG/thiol:disulfide interchange protein DsbE
MKIESTMAEPGGDPAQARQARRGPRWGLLVPLLVFVGIGIFFGIGLTKDPREIPSPLIGLQVPQFSLPPVRGRTLGLATADLHGEVSLVNVFASWCVACREEHPLLMEIKRSGMVPMHGFNYKDRPADAARWLDEFGDPYTRTGADINGRVAIDWGVYGVPETFVVDRDGRIAYKHIGPITPAAWNDKLLPLIRKLQQGAP